MQSCSQSCTLAHVHGLGHLSCRLQVHVLSCAWIVVSSTAAAWFKAMEEVPVSSLRQLHTKWHGMHHTRASGVSRLLRADSLPWWCVSLQGLHVHGLLRLWHVQHIVLLQVQSVLEDGELNLLVSSGLHMRNLAIPIITHGKRLHKECRIDEASIHSWG